jgi:histidinol-phosphate aminotransferase
MTDANITHAFRDAAKGLDFYWPGTSVAEACERYGLRPEDVAKMASNENAYGSSPEAIAAAREALDHAAIYPSAKYDYAGLKRALAGYAGVPAEMVVPGPGSESVARYITHLFVSPGDEVITGAQSYDGHRWVSQLMGGVVREVPLVDYRYDLDAVLAALNERTRIVWLCNPINPTGTILTRAEAQRIVEAVPPTVAVVFDQAYREYVDAPEYGDGLEFLLAGHRNVVVLRTLSKVFGLAAVRLGYGIADAAIGTIIDSTCEPFHLSGPACAAGVAAVTRDLEWAAEKRDAIVTERRRLERELAGLGLSVVPSQGNFILFDAGADSVRLYEGLLSRGIILRLGSIWTYDTHLRVTVGTPEQNDRLIAALAAELRAK